MTKALENFGYNSLIFWKRQQPQHHVLSLNAVYSSNVLCLATLLHTKIRTAKDACFCTSSLSYPSVTNRLFGKGCKHS